MAVNIGGLENLGKPIIIFFGILVGLALITGIAIWIYINRQNKKKFTFLLFSKDRRTARTIYAKVKSDPQNPAKKKFFFDELDSPLEIKAPNFHMDGKPKRLISYNNLNEYSYLDGVELDDAKYLTLALEPEEKAIALHRYKEQQLRYHDPFDKLKVGLMVGMVIMVILVSIAVIFSTYNLSQSGKVTIDIIKESQKTTIVQKEASDNLLLATETLAIIYGVDGVVNRTVS